VRLGFLDEPELEFGGGGTHIDVRFGIAQFGPLDLGGERAPSDLRVGIIGTPETVDAVRSWLERCRKGVRPKETRLRNLFPGFPGLSRSGCFGADLIFDDRWIDTVHTNEVRALLSDVDAQSLSSEAADVFLSHADKALEEGGPDVMICAPPSDLFAALDDPGSHRRHDPLDDELDEGSDQDIRQHRPTRQFHDLLKARGLPLRTPIQLLRPKTYGFSRKLRRSEKRRAGSLQDEATRAWNLHIALYYKAGGIPWRMVRDPAALTTCFVGISFYRTPGGDRLLTSMAHVFNERGVGTIVRGGEALLDKVDRQPHLSSQDSTTLLGRAIRAYRREHKTQPARVVLHKTSRYSDEEREGFEDAARAERVDTVDLISLRRSYTRLFREGSYPPLRGTWLELDEKTGILYLKGSVDFFRAYPGLYVPRPIEYYVEHCNTAIRDIVEEFLALSKLNWNSSQFDGGEPITVRAARRVGDILKHVEDPGIEASFRFFM